MTTYTEDSGNQVEHSTAGVVDTFSDVRRLGSVIGSSPIPGVTRKGVDTEGVLGVDHGALRIQPLVKSRWGRAAITYGPFRRVNGLSFATYLLNGHNTSETGALPERLRQRLWRWLVGNEVDRPLVRLRRFLVSGHWRYFGRRLVIWAIGGSRLLQIAPIVDNLAVGWFGRELPYDPTLEGHCFLMHALGPECGELRVHVGSHALRAVSGVQNVPLYLLVMLRERGAAYYAASIPGARDFTSFPTMKALGIDPSGDDLDVYGGIHQSVLGQIGFRVDTRVYRAQVAVASAYSEWYGTALGADRLTGSGTLPESMPSVGESWGVWKGDFERTPQGLQARVRDCAAVMKLPSPPGLVHAVVETYGTHVSGVALLWRVADPNNYWSFEVGSTHCRLSVCEAGRLFHFPATAAPCLLPHGTNSIQVSDDGEAVRLYLNGHLVYGGPLSDRRLNHVTGVGIRTTEIRDCFLRDFEAHPRTIPVPPGFEFERREIPYGELVAIEDTFVGGARDLMGRKADVGNTTWRRDVGIGSFALDGQGAVKVLATRTEPCPGRTAYTVAWDNPRFVDGSVEITMPGMGRGEGERGRGGLIFWQDDRNYLTISTWVNDAYGMSLSSFFQRDGYEELYDAVWTNIGTRIHWGVPYVLRVRFDSQTFVASINDEPVLYRSLRDIYHDWEQLLVHRVGIVANWEWGNDTGSTFRRFIARDVIDHAKTTAEAARVTVDSRTVQRPHQTTGLDG
jgi:hypothetical protein